MKPSLALCHKNQFAGLLTLIVLAIWASCCSPSSPPFMLAYNVLVNAEADDYDIWTVDPQTGDIVNITNHPDVAWTYEAWEDRIFFISDRDTCRRCMFLYEMGTTGDDVRRITSFRLRDSWMSSRSYGREIIVNPHLSVDSAFYVIDRSGAVLSRIYTGLPFASDPSFSPEGTRIAFRGALKKSKREAGFKEAIYLIRPDGSGLQKLTEYPTADTTAPWYAYKAGPPRWHPTENFISFQSYQNGKYSLYAVTPDGQRQWKLTEVERQEGYHAWSPDGKWLTIEIFDDEQTQFHIGLMNWETKELEILTDTTYQYQQAPVFAMKR